MAKKFKKTAKEIQRLSGLYQQTSQPIGMPSVPVASAVGANPASMAVGTLASAHAQKHAIIRRDLISLLIVASIMLIILFALNYLIDHTSLEGILTQMVGRII